MKKIQPEIKMCRMRNTLDEAHEKKQGQQNGGRKGKPWMKLSRNPMLQNEELKDEE